MPPPLTSVPRWRPPEGSPLDSRVHAFRPDLADAALIGRVDATTFAYPTALRCAYDRVAIVAGPRFEAPPVSELLHGETFQAIGTNGDWAWGWCDHDRYVGYVCTFRLDEIVQSPTHRVVVPRAPEYFAPDIKASVGLRLPLGALTSASGETKDFIAVGATFLHKRHIAALADVVVDPVEAASRLIGSPYTWGGRGGAGIDCSGLIQVALSMCGIAAPRDSDQQMAALGRAIEPTDARRGDLVFFPGHVGIMADGQNLLHANAHWMTTLIEPLADVVARLAPAHPQPVLGIKRLD